MGRVKRRESPYKTLSEILEKLHFIPPERILLEPPPGTATENDVLRAERRLHRLCELYDATLVEKPLGFCESRLAMVLGAALEGFAAQHDLGVVLAPDAMLRVDPGQVRMPDLSFFSWNRFPNRELPSGAILDGVPDLAIEILSPTNTAKEMTRKRQEYFLGGCKQVWEIDPIKKSVRVYTGPDEARLIREKGTLSGSEVLPGFELKVADLFARAGRRAEKPQG